MCHGQHPSECQKKAPQMPCWHQQHALASCQHRSGRNLSSMMLQAKLRDSWRALCGQLAELRGSGGGGGSTPGAWSPATPSSLPLLQVGPDSCVPQQRMSSTWNRVLVV